MFLDEIVNDVILHQWNVMSTYTHTERSGPYLTETVKLRESFPPSPLSPVHLLVLNTSSGLSVPQVVTDRHSTTRSKRVTKSKKRHFGERLYGERNVQQNS